MSIVDAPSDQPLPQDPLLVFANKVQCKTPQRLALMRRTHTVCLKLSVINHHDSEPFLLFAVFLIQDTRKGSEGQSKSTAGNTRQHIEGQCVSARAISTNDTQLPSTVHGSCATLIELSLRWHEPADAAPLYEHSCQTLGWTVDADRMSSMRKANEEQLSKLEASIKDAEENLGDIEVRDAFLAKADYLYKIGAHSSGHLGQ